VSALARGLQNLGVFAASKRGQAGRARRGTSPALFLPGRRGTHSRKQPGASPRRATVEENTNTLTQAPELTIDGLQEAIKLAESKQAKKAQKADKLLAEKVAAMVALRDGVVTESNPKGNHNPQIFPESVRQVPKGELVDGLVSKGWVVTIRCETCGNDRIVNLQDAFQVRFCSKSCKPKKSGSTTGTKAARELLKQHSLDDLKKLLAEKQAAQAETEAVAEAA